ncbi:MAG: DUF4338 domain-containing protein [Bacillota bacterium]|nr:DUF4338 domain-containing protein [Bacillota bacterium]
MGLDELIRRRLMNHLRVLGLVRGQNNQPVSPDQTKAALRALHVPLRREKLRRERAFVSEQGPRLLPFFADGKDLNPESISPALELIRSDTWQSRLFRLASLTWSVPVSQGYGRRLRYLVWDQSNDRLIGLFALGDPVFNLRVRDSFIGWTAEERSERLVHMMDAYILGAVPPYSQLLAGKLIACLVRTREVRDAFSGRYGASKGIISGKVKAPTLSFVTTSSALGRSSVYNRLVLGGIRYFASLGYTSGWGHFHIPQDLFELCRQYLDLSGDPYASNNRFGDGPNWRMRALRKALSKLDLDPSLLQHGVRREVFSCELARNARQFLAGTEPAPDYQGLLSVAEVGTLARKRWMEPRAKRHHEYQLWDKEAIIDLIVEPPAASEGEQHVAR